MADIIFEFICEEFKTLKREINDKNVKLNILMKELLLNKFINNDNNKVYKDKDKAITILNNIIKNIYI